MSFASQTLPDDPAQLKQLLIKERVVSEKLKQQIHTLLEALRLEKHRLYGKSSEKSPDQVELFDEADSMGDETGIADDEPAAVTPGKKTKARYASPCPLNYLVYAASLN